MNLLENYLPGVSMPRKDWALDTLWRWARGIYRCMLETSLYPLILFPQQEKHNGSIGNGEEIKTIHALNML